MGKTRGGRILGGRDLPLLSQSGILDILALPVMVVDRELRIVYANEMQKRRYGPDLEGTLCHRALRRFEDPCPGCILRLAMETGQIQRKEMTNTLPSGEVIHGVQTATPLRNLTGRITAAVEVVTDITGEVAARQLLERRKQEAEALHTLALELLAEPDLAAAAQRVTRKTRELLEADAAVLTVPAAEQSLHCLAADGLAPDQADTLARELLAPHWGQLADTPGPMILRREGSDPPVTWLAAALRAGDEATGLLAVGKAGEDALGNDASALAAALAGQAAQALERGRLLAAAQTRADQLSLLAEVGGLLTVVSGEEDTLQLVTGKLLSAIRCYLVFITLAEPAENRLLLAGAAAQTEELAAQLRGRTLPLEGSLCLEVMRGGQPLHLPQPAASPQLNSLTRELFAAHRINDLLAVPLVVRDDPIGVLYLARREPYDYSPEELAALTVLAGQAATAVQNSRLYASLGSYLADILALQEVGSKILHLERDTDLHRLIVESVRERLSASLVALDVVLPGRETLTCVECQGERAALLEHPSGGGAPPGSPLAFLALEGQSLVLDPVDPDRFPDSRLGLLDVRRAMVVPLLSRKKVVGALTVYRGPQEPPFTQREKQTIALFANYAGIGLENARLFRETRRLAITDELTGLYNYRFVMDCLERELKRAERRTSPLGLLLLDLDHFKRINDNFGHQIGDRCLQSFAQHLRAFLRSSDLPARYGGEEFVVILPDTDLEGAQALAQKLCVATRTLELPGPEEQPLGLTVSIGVAAFPECGEDLHALLRTADAALYRAKRQGRDCISVARVRRPSAQTR